MKLTVTHDDTVVQLDVYEDMELENLIAYIEAEINVSFHDLALLHNAVPLTDPKKSLKQLNIADGDMVLVVSRSLLNQAQQQQQQQPQQQLQQPRQPPPQIQPQLTTRPPQAQTTSSQPTAGGSSGASNLEDLLSMTEVTLDQAKKVMDSFLANPDEVTNLKLSNMPLADALTNNNLEEFHKILNEQHKRRREEHHRRLRMLTADPFDVEAQRMIAEEIQRQQIESNMQDAIEFMPEAFGQVNMLYIKCKVNGHPIDAFVDSGAQSTIMSKSCAELCNVMRLLDERWSGVAQGVGTQKILGRIHMCQIQIGNDFLPVSFSVLEKQPMSMLLGLDMLKRHQCIIDLGRNVLKIGTTGTETKFLDESELPEHARH